jgi:hypothetical protein
MTGGYGLALLPLMTAKLSAMAPARRWRRTLIYEAWLEQGGNFLDRNGKPQGPSDPVRLSAYELPTCTEF